MTFKHGHELTRAIKSLFATGPADLAVAYWGSDACAQLTLPSDLTGFRVACDAHSGFCSHIAMKHLLVVRRRTRDPTLRIHNVLKVWNNRFIEGS